MFELFGYYLQGGLIDVGFLGAAQIDRFGNINTTVIGDYAHPTTRLPGVRRRLRDRDQRPRGLRDHAPVARGRSSRRSTSGPRPGNLGGAEQADRIRREGGWLGRGPSVVVTDLGIYHFDETGEMRLDSLHPGATLDDVRATIGWDVKVADDLAVDAAADARGAAADPRGARPGRRLHPLRSPPSIRGQPRLNETRNSSAPSSAIERMKPPTFGAAMSKSASGNVIEPATWIRPSASCAWAGISTARVTPWRVRSPTRTRSVGVPSIAAAAMSTVSVRTNVALGNRSVSRPSVRSRSSRRPSSDAIVVVSTVRDASVSWAPLASPVSVMLPVTSEVRPTASDSAGRLASCSRTR